MNNDKHNQNAPQNDKNKMQDQQNKQTLQNQQNKQQQGADQHSSGAEKRDADRNNPNQAGHDQGHSGKR